MKIIHTGDWHMNHRLGRIDMTSLIQDAIRQIADHLEKEQAEVLIIAGDLFSGHEGREQLSRSVRFLKQTFGPFLNRGGTILALSGNHDSEPFFETLRDAFDLVALVQADKDGIHSNGRFYIAPNPRVLTLRDTEGYPVQFMLLPYPTPRLYLSPEEIVKYETIEARNSAMANVFQKRVEFLVSDHVRKEWPTVLVSHAQVRGVPTSERFLKNDEHDVVVEVSDLPMHFAYGAFGHIHRSGPVAGGTHFRYSGSLLPLDASEAGHDKSVMLVEVGSKGRCGEPRPLTIMGPRLLDLVLRSDEIGSLRDTYQDCETALVKYCLRYDPDTHPDPFPLHQQVREVFPYWYDSKVEAAHARTGAGEPNTNGSIVRPSLASEDLAGNVLGYLRDVTEWGPKDADKDAVIILAESLLADDAFMAIVKTRKEA